MGYYTRFKLSVHFDAHESMGVSVAGESEKRLIEYIKSIADEDDYLKQFVDPRNDDLKIIDAKWYDHEKDMVSLSYHFPEVVLCLEGVGENGDDYWKKYFRAGKILRCYAEVKIIYPEFDVSKMETFVEEKE